MVHWIYILRCESDIIYVGETKRLFKRFWEHTGGRGSVNTSKYKPIELVAIYKINTILDFMYYNYEVIKDKYNYSSLKTFGVDKGYTTFLDAENNITERMMIRYNTIGNDWTKIRGGKYTKNNIFYRNGISYEDFKIDKNNIGKVSVHDIKECPSNLYIEKLPCCECGYPCDIKVGKNHFKPQGFNLYLYFRCAKKNIWEGLKDTLKVDVLPCNFYQEYILDKKYR
jgi:predicted GIY-YIG superfamily endonuclease